MPDQHLSASYARILFRHLKLNEANGARFFDGSHIKYADLMGLNSEISFEDQQVLFHNALKIAESPGLGLSVGKHLHLSSHGQLGVAAFSSPTLGDALRIMVTYGDVRAQFINISSEFENGELSIFLTEAMDLGDTRCFLIESVMSAIYSAVMFFVGQSPINAHIELAYDAPDYAGLYKDAYRIPVYFGKSKNKLVLEQGVLNTPSPVADEGLCREAIEHCQKLQLDLQKTLSTKDRVVTLLANNPGKLWSQDEVAQELHMSSRTLIRKLALEGAKFQSLRDELVKQQALNYLKSGNMSVENIAYLLGFSDVSSFRRSFKRWFECSPSEYVKMQN